VTAREHSVLTINEVPGTSTVDLSSGRISVVVDKAKMKAGEVVEIRTPNAVAGIRGTIVVAETNGTTSTISVLRGLVDVYRVDQSGKTVGTPTPVGPREAVTVRGDVLPPRPQTLSTDSAGRLSNEFKSAPQPVSALTTLPPSEETGRARSVLAALNAGPVDPKRETRPDKGNGLATGGGAASPKLATTTTLVTSDTSGIRQVTGTTSTTNTTNYLTPLTRDKVDKLLLRK